MKRRNFHSVRGCWESGSINQSVLFTERMKLKQRLWKLDTSCLSNTDEVSLLYRTLLRRANRDSRQLSSYDLTKDRLTTVLSVHADGRKGTLTIIRTAAHPLGSPKDFDPAKDLNIFYKSQISAWNTQLLRTQMFRGFYKRSRLQNRNCVNILDSYSTPTINHSSSELIEPVLLRPLMTNALQQLDGFVGRSFECVLRRLLVEHILEFVKHSIALPAEEHKPFRPNEAVTKQCVVKILQRAWYLVPVSVELNGWLKSSILSSHQRKKIVHHLNEGVREVKPAEKAFEQSCLNSKYRRWTGN